MEGLRVLARVIARHCLAHPELYPAPTGDSDGGTGNAGQDAHAVGVPAREGRSAARKEASG